MRKAAARAALIGVMLGGGLLYAGISQAQDAGGDMQAERSAELVAASGGPAPSDHLIAFTADKAAVEARDDDVAALPTASSELSGQPQPVAAPAAVVEPAPVSHVAAAELTAYTAPRR